MRTILYVVERNRLKKYKMIYFSSVNETPSVINLTATFRLCIVDIPRSDDI